MDQQRELGFEALAIPHNPNASNGLMFDLRTFEGEPLDADYAAQRMRNEPIVEMTQIKGDSECRNGMFEVLGEPDELCDYEKTRDFQGQGFEDCEEGEEDCAP